MFVRNQAFAELAGCRVTMIVIEQQRTAETKPTGMHFFLLRPLLHSPDTPFTGALSSPPFSLFFFFAFATMYSMVKSRQPPPTPRFNELFFMLCRLPPSNAGVFADIQQPSA